MMDTVSRSIRYAGRRLVSRPGFTLVAIVSLALGIGANTAIFTLVNSIMLRAAPLDRPEELVEVYLSSPVFEYGVFSWPDFDDFELGTQGVFSHVSATMLSIVQADTDEGVEVIPAELVSGNYFALRGIGAEVGRVLLPEDDVSPGAHPVVMLGYGYWQSAFGGNPDVVGDSVRLGGRPYSIVGVAPRDYPGHLRGVAPSLFAPRMMVNELQPGSQDQLEARGNHGVFVTARLRQGTTLARAQTEADALAESIREKNIEDFDPQSSFLFVPTNDVILFPPFDRFMRAAAWLLMGVVSLVLLIACVNLASFLLARALDRKKEIALRLALGATRRDLIGQLLAETMLLSLIGGLVGLAVSIGLLRLLVSADLPLPLPITFDFSPDATVLGFGFAVSVVAGLLLGLAPALQSTNPDVSSTIKDESTGGARRGSLRLRNMLVVSQIALSLVLLVGAGLFLRSMQRIQTVDPGFGNDPAAILTVVVPSTRYSEEQGRALVSRVLDRFQALPGVVDAGLTSNLHLNTLSTQTMSVNVDGVEPPPERDAHTVDQATVDAGFFHAVGVHILRGRNFAEADEASSRPVAIINQAFAEKFWPAGDGLGQIIRRADDEDLLVVGIASNAKIRSLGESPRAFVYRPYSQTYTSFLTLVATTTTDPQRTALELMATAREVDPELMIWEAKTMDRHLGIVLLPARLSALILTTFAALALVLASIGLYGTVSYSVSSRTREVGIRISVGAGRRDVTRMMMAGGLRLVAFGGAVGLVAALLLAPVLSSLLFGIRAVDLVAFTAMPLLLGVVAIVAAYVPARRASRIDPVRALRSD